MDQVCDWLCSSGFTQYEPAFRLNGIDGRRLIFVASAASLASMRVSGTELTHARALAKQVRVLLGLDDDDHGRLRSVADAPAPPLQLFLERVAREGDSFQARSGAFQLVVQLWPRNCREFPLTFVSSLPKTGVSSVSSKRVPSKSSRHSRTGHADIETWEEILQW